jgi:hypothetical protein
MTYSLLSPPQMDSWVVVTAGPHGRSPSWASHCTQVHPVIGVCYVPAVPRANLAEDWGYVLCPSGARRQYLCPLVELCLFQAENSMLQKIHILQFLFICWPKYTIFFVVFYITTTLYMSFGDAPALLEEEHPRCPCVHYFRHKFVTWVEPLMFHKLLGQLPHMK